MSLFESRFDYAKQTLEIDGVDPDPLRQVGQWLQDARDAQIIEPTAAMLATVGTEGRPSARVVLLRAIDAHGVVFYTSYGSRKAQELRASPWAALVLFWAVLERQVRIEGSVETLPATESDAYFASRPRDSQLGAWASPQSQVIPDRAWLEARWAGVAAQFESQSVPRPADWGGFRVRPTAVELWQGRPHRLHDRIRYTRPVADEPWLRERLAP